MTENVGIIVGAVVTVGLALGGLLMSHGSKLASILTKVDALKEGSARNDVDHARICVKIDDHGQRLTKLETTCKGRHKHEQSDDEPWFESD